LGVGMGKGNNMRNLEFSLRCSWRL